MHKDGLGAALGTVGVAVPSDEHCEAMRRSEVTAVTRGPSGGWSVRGPAHCPKIFFRVAYMAAALLTMHEDGLGAALGTVGAPVPSE